MRLSFLNNGSGAEVLEENNYYPFGLKHEGYNILTGNPTNQYKYNGKELQEFGMYDYGARMYMPDIGRWGVMDPLSELYYPISAYNYAANNPIKFIDPTGMWITITDGGNTYRYMNGGLYSQNSSTKAWDAAENIPENSYAAKILSALNSMTGGDTNSFGSMFLEKFSNDQINANIQSSNSFGIEDRKGTNFTYGNDVYTGFNQNPFSYTSLLGERPKQTKGAFYINLFHELGHSWLNQTYSYSELKSVWVDKDTNNLSSNILQSEIAATYIENKLRSEQGLPLRISYSTDADVASTLTDINSIKLSPIQLLPPNTLNLKNRVFTMPVNRQQKVDIRY